MKNCPICKTNDNFLERKINNIGLICCRKCSFRYIDLSDEEILKANSLFFKEEMSLYAEIQTELDGLWHEHIVKKFSDKLKKRRVLDIGCGNGLLLKKFKDYGWDCWGCDLSPWGEEGAKRYGFEFYKGEIGKSNFPQKNFDLIVSLSTFEHIVNPIIFLKDVLPFLKEKGICYFAGIPNYNSLSIKLGFSNFHHNEPPYHCNFFIPKVINSFNKYADFSLYKIYVKTYGIPEMHRIYNFFTKIFRKVQLRKSGEIIEKNHGNIPTKAKRGIPTIYKFFIYVNYFVGRLGNLGDKIEIFVEKLHDD